MSFVDKVSVNLIAGKGGDGLVSFRREKFVDKGGPNGGDGGNGGDIILTASNDQNTLAAFRYKKEIKAEAGHAGGQNRKHGRSAPKLELKVPVGTIAIDEDSGSVLADLVADGQQAILARGGIGGFGNAHFISSVRQTPKFAEKGEPGEEKCVVLELKMIADVGLVGLPNAGKSTLLSKLSNARPEIANYPFTTLKPNLGVVDIDKDASVLMADIPGLIEGAADGKGLGHDFLRHVERTAVILHLIDSYNEDVVEAYQTIRAELEAYQPELIKRPEIILLTKVEGLDNEIIDDLMKQVNKATGGDVPIFAISSQSGEGLKQLRFTLKRAVEQERLKPETQEEYINDSIPVLKLENDAKDWEVVKRQAIFYVTGAKIEKFAKRTDFDNEDGVQRLRDIMRRQGIMHELSRQEIKADQIIQIGASESRRFKY